jgi:hypothetical protein
VRALSGEYRKTHRRGRGVRSVLRSQQFFFARDVKTWPRGERLAEVVAQAGDRPGAGEPLPPVPGQLRLRAVRFETPIDDAITFACQGVRLIHRARRCAASGSGLLVRASWRPREEPEEARG